MKSIKIAKAVKRDDKPIKPESGDGLFILQIGMR